MVLRWGWKLILGYSYYSLIRNVCFPKRTHIAVPDLRDLLKANAEHFRQARVAYAQFVYRRKNREEIAREGRALLKSGHSEESPEFDAIMQLMGQQSTIMRNSAEDVRSHVGSLHFPTKTQMASARKMLAVIDRHYAKQDAASERDYERDIASEQRNMLKMYNHGVKHGHISPAKMSFKEFCAAKDRAEYNPAQLSPTAFAVCTLIAGLYSAILYVIMF